MNFTYGFNLTTAPKDSVTINFGDPGNSSTQGFSQTSITDLPFRSNADEVDLSLDISLRPQLLLGILLFGDHDHAGAGFFFDVPRLSANISTKKGVNSDCEKDQNADASSKGLLIEPEIELDVGVELEAELDISKLPLPLEKTKEHTLFSTSYPLPTACSRIDEVTQSYDQDEMTASSTTGLKGPVASTGRYYASGTPSTSYAYSSDSLGATSVAGATGVGTAVAESYPIATTLIVVTATTTVCPEEEATQTTH